MSDEEEADVRQAMIAMSDIELEQVLNAREYEALTKGYREQVNDMHLDHIADLPKVLPGLFADAAHRATGPDLTVSSCTMRTPTPWRLSCRPPTGAMMDMAGPRGPGAIAA